MYKQPMDTPAEPGVNPAPSVLQLLLGGALAALIALACVLPPLLHIVTGPLGPAIGGFVVAQRLRPDGNRVLLLASALGITLATLATGTAAFVITSFGYLPPEGSSLPSLLALLAGGAFVYGTGLGALGASLGTRSGSKDAKPGSA